MEARGINKRKPLGILIALLIVGAAVGLAVKVASRTKLSTDDAASMRRSFTLPLRLVVDHRAAHP
jgi:hypothetical protein